MLRSCPQSLDATRKGHYRACHFGTTCTFCCKIFLACGWHLAGHHLHAALHLGGRQCCNLGASARHARARTGGFLVARGHHPPRHLGDNWQVDFSQESQAYDQDANDLSRSDLVCRQTVAAAAAAIAAAAAAVVAVAAAAAAAVTRVHSWPEPTTT